MSNITFDRYSFIINNRRVLIRAAAVHYFRLPGEYLWRDRLSKLQFAGYNTIDMYIPWGYHSHKRGQFDFSGMKDINNLMKIAGDLGLFIIARPGPYINAELSRGGFPGWLMADKNIVLRNRKDGAYIYSEKYMEYVREWYKEVIPRINKADNVIALQVENEYYTDEMEEDYIKELVDLVRSLGCTLPISHNDMYSSGLYSNIVDIYGIDNYSVTYFDYPWKSFPEVFSVLDNLEENIRGYCQNSPIYIAELQAGWFDKWGGIGYEKMGQLLGREHIDIVTKTSLAQGVTAFTHYMACGGINWNNLGSTEVYTSYDFASPLSETGIPTDRFYHVKNINYFLESFDLSHTELAENQPDVKSSNPDASIKYRTRTSLRDNSRWLFVRNDTLGDTEIVINGEYELNISPHQMIVLPSGLNINLLNLNYSTLPLICKISNDDDCLVVVDTRHTGEMSLSIDDPYVIESTDTDNIISLKNIEGNIILSLNKEKNYSNPILVKIKVKEKTTRFLFIPPDLLDYLHIIDNTLIIGPEYLTTSENKTVYATSKATEVLKIDSHGNISKESQPAPETFDNIDLSDWNIVNLSKENLIEDSWTRLNTLSDMDSNNIHDGFCWYKCEYNGSLDKIKLNVRHCFAVYLNNQEIYSHDSFNSVSGKDTDKAVTVNIPDKYQKDANTLTLLVQSMGHNKGFEDDAQNPRGILSYETIPKKDLQWYIKPALIKEDISDSSLKQLMPATLKDKLICASTQFKINVPAGHQIPVGLVFGKVPFNKANIYLNDNLIGHYWQDKGPQNKFYLPESLYNSTGELNTLKLVIWYRSNDKNKYYPTDFNNANIYLELFKIYKLSEIQES